ncbi:MAG TPA: YHS domain-containing protein [Planctomycetaceae bacterium]|nr:YHS domain-containing protein [Planctomycetaceae bacterium]
MSYSIRRAFVFVGVFVSAAALLAAQQQPDKSTKAAKEALSQFNSLIGGWRGTAQPRRGSAAGSWRESAEWVWDFSQPAPAIRYVVSDGKLLKSARITFDDKASLFRAMVELPDGSTREYSGKFDEDRLVLNSQPDAKNEIHRLTVTRLNDKRTIVLFEKKRATSRGLARVAEVGYTREGTRLAVEGGDGPECVVTGGKGTIAISYKGQTYYVCCSGCKQAFNENPEKILAEYRQRIEARNKAAK